MKKYFFPFIIILIGLLCLSGCSNQSSNRQNRELIRAAAPSYDQKYITIGFIQTGKESDWRDANTNDYLNTFTEEKGYNLIYIDGNSNPDRQRKAAYDLIAQQVDYMIIDPIVENNWDEVLLLAQEKEIPVIIADRMVNSSPSLYECWIGSDTEAEGINAAKWLQSYLEETNRQHEDINIVILVFASVIIIGMFILNKLKIIVIGLANIFSFNFY